MQINPTATSQDDGLRISRSATKTGNSSIQLGYSRTSNTGLIEGFVIAVTSQAGDNTRRLQISANGNTLTFNGNGLVDVGTDQTITGTKTFGKLLQVIPTVDGTFDEGIKISRNPINQWSNIQFGSDPNSNTGFIDNQWLIGTIGNNGQNQLGYTIVKAGQEGSADRRLQIFADGNTLSFNGWFIARTGAANGSVNYSQGNSILWGANSLETDGGFYNNETNIF
ncbi:MAG: hypothetical protein EZS28_010386 [Streblomastix strix]|uniref:Uncharacterized protein n=1 Tax=Streblomastix strix TaxID=222440 RepID=A0A5J4WGK6_9EUKA|nr:MAG: hypothetical protein EZS28_010386 [Streblomastix strix]